MKSVAVSLIRRTGARAYLYLALIFSILILGNWGLIDLVSAAEIRLFDTLISHRLIVPTPDPDIVIVDIDEASLAGMAPEFGRWPWPNKVFGELVDRVGAQNPKAIVFDILFSDPDTQRPDSDAAFNSAIARSSSTFFPMLRLDPKNDSLSRIPVGALPGVVAIAKDADASAHIAIILPKVSAAIENGRLGTHQVRPDKDGIIRRYPAWLDHAGWRIPSLPQRIAQEYSYPGANHADVLLNWRGPPFTYQYRSFVDVYRELKHPQPGAKTNPFAGKIVLIGSTAPSLFDVKGTPLARIHPGVEILATAIDNFKNGDGLRERPAWVMMAAALLLIWSMAIALYRQTRIEVFDTVFTVLQVTLVLGAFVVLNLSSWYLDTSAPLSLGVMYFTVARVYYGVSLKWLATSQIHDLSSLPKGERLLGVLAIRFEGMKPAERRRLKGDLDRLVARSSLRAGRIANLVEDPGFVQRIFSDVMLVYWLLDDLQADWESDSAKIESGLAARRSAKFQTGLLRFARQGARVRWESPNDWVQASQETVLLALQKVASNVQGKPDE
jgi:CHASE2 domain-containing sensor protein